MARSFNGSTSNFLNVGSAVVTSLPITMSAWFNCTSQTSVSNTIISIANTAFLDRWYRLVVFPSGTTPPFQFSADLNDGFGNYIAWNVGNTVNSGTWYHGCVIFTSLTSRVIYLNGGSKTTNSTGQSAIVGLNATSIGLLNRSTPVDPANALIDKVGIWNVALTDAEVLALANGALPSQIRPAALVGNWPVDGLQSPEPDYSGAAQNMVINGTVPVAAGSPTMPFTRRGANALFAPTIQPFGSGVSGSRSFNGTSDAITASPGPGISGSTTLAVAFWLKWTTFANTDNLAMEYSTNYNSNTGTFILDPNGSTGGGGGFFEVGNNLGGASPNLSYFTRPSAGVFHQYVVNYNASLGGVGSIVSVYVDGVSQSLTNQFASGTSGTFGNFSLYFMSRAAASLFGAGSMADVAIYNVNLTAGEALALFRGARPFTVRPKSLISYWPLNALSGPYPEPDLSGNAFNGTLTGTTPAPGPPVMQFTPRWPQFFFVPPPFVLWAQSAM